MKNKIYVLGITVTLFTVAGCMFKIMHWPGANILLTLGLVLVSLVFLPIALRSSFKTEENRRQKVLYILAAVVLAFNFMAALFKILHWPGASVLFLICMPLPFVLLLPAYLLSNPVDNNINYKNFMAVMFFFAYFAAISALLSLSVSRNVIDGFVKSAISYEEKSMVIESNTRWITNNIATDTSANRQLLSKNRDITEGANQVCLKIDALKTMAIRQADNTEAISDPKSGNRTLEGLLNKDRKISLNESAVNELVSEISRYRLLLLEYDVTRSETNNIDAIFNTDADCQGSLNWNCTLLSNSLMISIIESLDILKFEVRLAENLAISKY